MRWRLYIEKYSPDLRYIKGENNVVADSLSRLEISAEPLEEAFFTEELRSELYCYSAETLPSSEFPLKYEQIQQAQLKDEQIVKEKDKSGAKYKTCPFNAARKTHNLICFGGKIVIPKELQSRIIMSILVIQVSIEPRRL